MPECLRDADSINAVLERGTFERDFTLGMQALGFGREPLSHKDLMAGALTPNWPPLTPSQILHACYFGKERATAAISAGSRGEQGVLPVQSWVFGPRSIPSHMQQQGFGGM